MAKKGRWLQSIHVKIPIILIILLVISLEIIGVFFIRELENQMSSNFRDQLAIQTSYIERTVQPILDNSDLDQAETSSQISNLVNSFTGPSVNQVQVYDENGFIMASNDPVTQIAIGQKSTDYDVQQTLLTARALSYEYFSEDSERRVYKIVTPLFDSNNSGNLVGIILMEADIESIYQQLQQIIVIFLTASIITIFLAIILSWILAAGITRPIQDMKDQAERISHGDYSGQLEIYGEDEIGMLGQTINELSTRVREAQEVTESERQRLDSVLRHMSDGVIGTDRRGRIVIINDSALNLLNINEDDAMGHQILDVLDLRDSFTFRQLFDLDQTLLSEIKTDANSVSIAQLDFSTIRRESGFIEGIVCVLSDVTEQEKIEQERREFVSNVSHELRTPLTSIRSYTDALLDGASEDPELSGKFLNVIQDESGRMMRMITDLLQLSHMDAENEQMEFELINYTDLLDHLLDRFDMILANEEENPAGHVIVREYEPSSYFVEISQDHFTRVIDNLLNNAIKYSPEGGQITVRLLTLKTRIILSIQDEGLGIPRRDIPNLFDRFYRVDKARSRKQGGSGLGLAIAQEVVHLHGGRIWVNSVEDKGSTFFISLPYTQFEEEEDWDLV